MAVVLTCDYPSISNGNTCTIDIHDRTGGGPAVDFCTRPTGAIVSQEAKTRDIYQSIIPRSCTFGILIENAAHVAFLESLAIAEENRYYVEIYTPALIFKGNIILDEVVVEDTSKDTYWFDLTATDGLADLQNIPYVDDYNNPYAGRKALSEHLKNVFSRIPTYDLFDSAFIQLPIFAAEMVDRTICPFEQSYVDHTVFQEITDDAVKPLDCYKVLELIMESFDSFVTTRGGEILISNWNSYGNPIDIPTFVYSDMTFSGGNYIEFSKYSTDICDNLAYALAGGKKVFQAPARTTTVTYHHGNTSNWLFAKKFLNIGYTEYCTPANDIPPVDGTVRFHFTGTLRYFVSDTRDPITNGARILTMIKIKIGSQYFVRQSTALAGSFITFPPEWTVVEDYYNIGQTGYIERYDEVAPLQEYNGTDNFDILSSEIPIAVSSQPLEICVTFRMYDRDNNILPIADYPANITIENPVFNFVNEDNVIIEKTSTSITVLNSVNNSKQFTRTMVMGDGPDALSNSKITTDAGGTTMTTEWEDTLNGSGYFPLHELVARSMMARRMRTLRIKEGEIKGIILLDSIIVYDGLTYMPLDVDEYTAKNIFRGEWINITVGNAWGLSSTNVVEEGKRPTGNVAGGGVVTGGGVGVGVEPWRKIYTGAMASILIPFTLGLDSLTEDQQAAIVWVFRNGVKMILGDSGINGFDIVESGGDLFITPILPFQANDIIETIYFI